MARIRLDEVAPDNLPVEHGANPLRTYRVVDFTRKTMPVTLGWLYYDGISWKAYRIRTQETIYYNGWTKRYLTSQSQVDKIKADFTKVYSGGVKGYGTK